MNQNFRLSNGKTIAQVENEMKLGIEKLYLDAWAKGISVPYRDENYQLHLANPDGSDDLVEFDTDTKQYTFISRSADAGKGRFAYLLS
jgi:hypothetical protein